MRTLLAIADSGGFRRAALRLNLTQPAVSQHMRRLEAQAGARIFITTRPNPQLSPVGEELVEYARRILALNDQALHRLGRSQPPQKLTVGISETLAEGLPRMVASLRADFPGVAVAVRTGLFHELAAEVGSRNLDAACGLGDGRDGHEFGVVGRFFGMLRLGWYGAEPLPPGGPVPLVVLAEPCVLRRTGIDALRRAGTPWQIAFEGPDLTAVRAAVRAGLGVACLIKDSDAASGLPEANDPPLVRPTPQPLSATFSPGLPECAAEGLLRAIREGLDQFSIWPSNAALHALAI
ncbi:MAG: LysR family transcriptional regulator [Streptomycetaceae bacterium]|nr:LysR family transcriptional regulator [Streptomycetaceae bacterium]